MASSYHHYRRDRLSKILKGSDRERLLSKPKNLREWEEGHKHGSLLEPLQRQRQGQASHFEAAETKLYRIERNIEVTAWDLGVTIS